MTSHIILSVGNGLLESKPIACGGHFPPDYVVPLFRFDFGRFWNAENRDTVGPVFPKTVRFKPSGAFRRLSSELSAQIYEMEI